MKKNRFLFGLPAMLLALGLVLSACDLLGEKENEPKRYTVTYDANGGSGTAPSSQTVNSGTAITLAGGSGLTKAGYTFSGWNTSASGTGTLYAAGASFTVTADITLYATWIVASGIQYTVTYDANGGSGTAPPAQTVNSGAAITLADGSGLTNSGYTFSEWNTSADGAGTPYASGASFTVTSDITLYAKWSLPAAAVPGSTLQDALEWLDSNAEQGGVYTITLSADETITPRALSYSGQTVSISIDGGTTERTISLSQNGSLFTVESSVTLTLGNNVTLQGHSANTASLVRVNSGGTLAMENGSKLTGNAVAVGGGVYVTDSGTFTMSGGEITGNTAASAGGGVFVGSGTFTMSGGEITGNTTTTGGGVFVTDSGTFTMSGGEITGNTTTTGGGVYVVSGTFTMSGGEITGNTTTTAGAGGGVFVSSGTFTMSGGEITGNTTAVGGGVYVGSGTVTKQSGGIIYGSDASASLRNTASSGYGHAVYANGKKRDSTAGVGVTLDSTVSGSAGGWE
ncbi:MAG: InlB B-repeat-containing protein [Treponema sp.]|nr:InlB B-repeat-containing protein [Treponema sp.]